MQLRERMGLDEEAVRLLNSSESFVGVEAAAGAGKTHLACRLSSDLADGLKPYQNVLFLSHTNAARDVFRRRALDSSKLVGRATLRTLDAFVLEALAPYARLFGLPVPLVPPAPIPAGWFARPRRLAASLLEQKPAIASAIVARFPMVIADEHQDASRAHHRMLVALAGAGARVRTFGDALQAILTFDPDIPGWDELMTGIPTASLTGAWRWRENPDLGEWIGIVRARLRHAEPIPLSDLPPCVRVVEVDGRGDWAKDEETLDQLSALSSEVSLVVLGRRNDQVRALARDSRLNLVVNEGSDLSAVQQLIAEGLAAPNAATRREVLVEFVSSVGTVPAATVIALRSGRPHDDATRTLLDDLARDGTLAPVLTALRSAYRFKHQLGWDIVHPRAVRAILALPTEVSAETIRDALYTSQALAGELAPPLRCASTIHKAKGLEFEHVVVPGIDAATFRGSREDRQLLYVALSRATSRLTLIVHAAIVRLLSCSELDRGGRHAVGSCSNDYVHAGTTVRHRQIADQPCGIPDASVRVVHHDDELTAVLVGAVAEEVNSELVTNLLVC
jgi:hypothetical protein